MKTLHFLLVIVFWPITECIWEQSLHVIILILLIIKTLQHNSYYDNCTEFQLNSALNNLISTQLLGHAQKWIFILSVC